MNFSPLFLLLLLFTNLLSAQSDAEQVEAVLNDYINGTSYNVSEKITRAFHPESNLYLTKNEDELRILPSKEYAGYFKEENRSKFNGRVGKVISIDLHRDIAYAKAEILMPARGFCYIDMFLVKKNEGVWSIIGKTASGAKSTEEEMHEIYNQKIVVNQYEETSGEQFHYEMPTYVERQMDSIFRALDNASTPGLTVGVVHRGKLAFSKSYGMANLAYGIPVTENTVFPIGSTSKQFTVMALLLLEKQGKLSLDDDLRKHLPEVHDYGTPITLRQLANHTSGIRSDLIMLGMAGYSPDDAITNEASLAMILRQKELNFLPGEQRTYSNGAYVLLAEVVARVSGKPFPTFVQEVIFSPLGMDQSLVLEDHEQLINYLADSYSVNDGNISRDAMNFSIFGSTGITTTIKDLSKWALNFRETTVGEMSIFKEMDTPVTLTDGTVTNYALGQFTGTHRGQLMIHHSGATAAYRSALFRFPEQDLMVVLLSNNSSVNIHDLALSVSDEFFDMIGIRYPERVETPGVSVPMSDKVKQTFTGNYLHCCWGSVRVVQLREGKLFYGPDGENARETELVPVGSNRFRLLADDELIEVEFDLATNNSDMVLYVDGVLEERYDKYIQATPTNKELEALTGKYFSEELQTSYDLFIQGGQLHIYHPRLNDIILEPLGKGTFRGSGWQFDTLSVERNEAGQVTGFRISVGRARNILFLKD